MKPSFKQRRDGFSLVITMGLMLLLLLLAVGMLSLSTVTIRAAGAERDMAIARANARMALIMAIGELQKYTGPDQRVTATSGLLDSNPSTPELDGVPQGQSHWTGVWRTTDPADNRPFITRNDGATGLQDRRPASEWKTPTGKKDAAMTWLVSGAENVDPLVQLPQNASVRMLRTLAPNDAEVRAPLINCGNNGGMAWWVADEGVKANLAIDHPYMNEAPNVQNPGVGYKWLTAAPSTQPTAINSAWSALTADAPKITSFDTMSLSAQGLNKNQFHDYTSFSQGLLVDVMRGGMRKDLSAYLLEGDQQPILNSIGLNDDSRLIGPVDQNAAPLEFVDWSSTKHQTMSPRFGLLRSWWGLSQQRNSLQLKFPKTATIVDDARINTLQPDFDTQTTAGVNPVLVEGSVYFDITYVNSGTPAAPFRPQLHVYPRVTLWNPHNVRMQVPDLVCYVRVPGRNRPITINGANPSACWLNLPGLNTPYGEQQGAGSFVFKLQGTSFEPGECLVFSKLTTGSTSYDRNNVSNNTLSATANPNNNANFYLPETAWFKKTNTYSANSDANDYSFASAAPGSLRYNMGQGGVAEDICVTLKAFQGTPPISFNRTQVCNQWVVIQNVSAHHAAGDGSSPAPSPGWSTSELQPLRQYTGNHSSPPFYKTKSGIRLLWLDETAGNLAQLGPNGAILNKPLLAQFNIRHQLHLRAPVEDVSTTAVKFFGNYVFDIWDANADWAATSPISLNGGKFGGNPFAATQDWCGSKYVAFDFPDQRIPLVSLAQLQHAPVSAFSWSPSFAIGNAWADPRVPANGTSPAWSTDGGWNIANFGSASIAEQFIDLVQRSKFGHTTNRGSMDDQLLVDLSYELNHQLWDRFFLSGSSTADIKSYMTSPAANNLLANARLRADRKLNANEITNNVGFHYSAKNLNIPGAFNVNSTSVEAWRAMLMSTRDKAPNGQANGRSTFPHVLTSADGAADGKAPDDPSAWVGFRSFSDAEVASLAGKIVEQVKIRGPFVSLSDFVNRRLVDDATGIMGALQAAIDGAGLNAAHDGYQLDRNANPAVMGPQKLRHKADATHKSAGADGYVQQADILQPLAPVLSARSDSFVVRAYGESRDKNGKVLARAWCEAQVQRQQQPIAPDSLHLNPDVNQPLAKFGREFVILGFRWLNSPEA